MTDTVPAPPGAAPGSIAHYTLLELLEPAGPGEVYRARDTKAGRTVTVRLLPADFPADADRRAALLTKARSLIAMSHPNIIALFDAGEHEGRTFLVFEFLKGLSLRGEMAGRPIKVRRALELAIQIADAIAYAHASGFIHGGLSPDSIGITAKGHAKIPVFEFAARSGFDPRNPDFRLHDYDSPEEANGQDGDERSDIYSVGAVLYEMLTTRRPMHRGAASPSVSNRNVTPDLDDIVLKAVAPNPASRIQNAATFAAELRAAAAHLDVEGGTGDDEQLDEAAPTVGRVVIIAAGILVVAGVLVWWLTG